MTNDTPIASYLYLLVKLNSIKPVTVNQDILNEQHQVVVASGSAITEETIQALKQHNLLNPAIEQAIQIEYPMTGNKLLACLLAFTSDYADILTIFEKEELILPVKWLIRAYETQPMLVQKLTVIAARMPKSFHKACFCTLINVALAQELQLTPNATRNLFLATLMQDVGMLYISPELLDKTIDNAQDWQTFNQYILRGAQFMNTVPGMPVEVSTALLEHHERCDGSGLPSAKTLRELSETGQILALTAKLYEIRFNFFEKTGQTLNEGLPALAINCHIFKQKHFVAASHLIRKTCMAKVNLITPKTMPAFIQELLEKIKCIGVWYRLVLDLEKIIPNMTGHILFTAMHNRILSIKFMVERSGVLSECMVRWVEYLGESQLETGYREVEEMSVMLAEIRAQLSDASQHINYILTERDTLVLMASKSKRLQQIKLECQDCALGIIPKAWNPSTKHWSDFSLICNRYR